MLTVASAMSRGVGGGELVGCCQRRMCPAAACHCSSPAPQKPDPVQHRHNSDINNFVFTDVRGIFKVHILIKIKFMKITEVLNFFYIESLFHSTLSFCNLDSNIDHHHFIVSKHLLVFWNCIF